MDKFCNKYGEDELLYLLPNNSTSEKKLRYKLLRHLLYDDERQTLLCFIPKVPAVTTITVDVAYARSLSKLQVQSN